MSFQYLLAPSKKKGRGRIHIREWGFGIYYCGIQRDAKKHQIVDPMRVKSQMICKNCAKAFHTRRGVTV